MAQTISIKSFEEVYKTAYSHGLENIYALEHVDIKTVRVLGGAGGANEGKTKKSNSLSFFPLEKDAQLTFDFGPTYNEVLEPFILREPIHVLGLTKYIENGLLAQGKKVLQDLHNAPPSGFGQGHIYEIQSKLQEYLADTDLKKTKYINFLSWLKSIVSDIDKKKLYVLLESYGLQSICKLSAGESMEVRRLTLEKRMEWKEEAESFLKTDEKRKQLDADVSKIVDAFVKPWMLHRHGIANAWELQERLQQLSDDGSDPEPVLRFFSEIYFNGDYPLRKSLISLGIDRLQNWNLAKVERFGTAPEVFASCRWAMEQYNQVVEKTKTYFYKTNTIYPLDQLVCFLENEFVEKWMGIQPDALRRILKTCPFFYVHKNTSGLLSIRRS